MSIKDASFADYDFIDASIEVAIYQEQCVYDIYFTALDNGDRMHVILDAHGTFESPLLYHNVAESFISHNRETSYLKHSSSETQEKHFLGGSNISHKYI